MTADQTPYLRVKIASADVSTHVWNLDVEDRDRGTDVATMLLDDPSSAVADGLQEGQHVEIDLGWESEHALVFVGCLTSVNPVSRNHTESRVRVKAQDISHLMTREPAITGPRLTRQHVGTLEEIVTAIADRHMIPLGEVSVDPMPSWTEDEPLLQACDQNDWQFLQDVAEDHHARAFVEVNAAEGDTAAQRERGGQARLYLMSEEALLSQDPMGKLHYCRGHGRLLEFDYTRTGGGASPSATATVTDPSSGSTQTSTGPEPAAGPDPQASPERAAEIARRHGERRAEDYAAGVQMAADSEVQPGDMRARTTVTGLPSSPELAERRIQQDRTRILGFQGRGVAMGTIFLRAKGPVEIDGLASWAAGRWYVHRVNHVVQRTRVDSATALTFRSRFVATK
ncbi:MAG: hypothetical protein AAF682_04035 [Planctomycetota bacterium]